MEGKEFINKVVGTEQVKEPDSEPINRALKEHALKINDWRYAEFVKTLHEWAEKFNREFELAIDTPAIQIDKIRSSALGTYRHNRNGFGLRHEISINVEYFELPLAEHLDTLLHEMLHEWQNIHGRPGKRNYHNNEFRKKALSVGLVIDARGRSHGVIPDGPFAKLLYANGVDDTTLLQLNEQTLIKRSGEKSKMKKWSCACTNVRSAVELNAQCLTCGAVFKRTEPAW